MSNMDPVITVRRLQRETPAVLREVQELDRPVTVTRNGVEVARILPISPAERLWRSWVRESGGDPDDPRLRPAGELPLPDPDPERPLSEVLGELRALER